MEEIQDDVVEELKDEVKGIVNLEENNSETSEPQVSEPKIDDSKIENQDVKKSEEKASIVDMAEEKTGSFLKSGWSLAFLAVLVLALLIRLKYIGQESIWNDTAVHLWYAVKVIKEPLFFFSSEYLTGDYLIIQTLTAMVYLFTKNVFIAGKIVAMLFGVVGIVFIYLLGTELRSKFVGVISAALLGFNHLVWFYGVRPLADGPLTAMIVVTLYFVVKVEKEKKFIWGLLAAAGFLAVMATKGQGALLFISFLFYVAVFRRKKALSNISLLVSWLIPLGFIVVGGLLLKRNFLAQVYNMFLDATGLAPQYAGLNAIRLFPWIFSWYLLVPMFLGILLVFLYKKKEYYFPLLFLLVYWLFFEVAIGTPEDRYILPILPVGILLFAFPLDELKDYVRMFLIKKNSLTKIVVFVTKVAVVLFVVFICWNFYTMGDELIYNKSFSYGGHPEAGQWIKENVPEEAIIFSGGPRIVRAFAEREYGGPENRDKGGTLWWLREAKYLENQTAFEEDLLRLSKEHEVYLEINIWEYTQAGWYYPITQESLNLFIRLGFEIVHVVERETPTPQGMQKMPVIFLFKYVK